MPGGLPSVLITNTGTITKEINSTGSVQVEDVAKLWRVHTLKSNHTDDTEAARLENFFWRIWSNPNIIGSIRGNTLARLFTTISDGGNRVRTTPVPSPLATTPDHALTSPPLLSEANLTHVLPRASNQPKRSPGAAQMSESPARSAEQPWSPPILKKSPASVNAPSKSARISPPDDESIRSGSGDAQRESFESGDTLSSPSLPTDKGLKNAAKKRTSFATAAGARKARPGSMMRKRSSQSSASGEQRKSSQISPSPGLPPAKTMPKAGPKSTLGLPPLATATFALPSGSWQDVDSPASSRTSLDNSFTAAQQPSSWLVDKNFRRKFVEHQKRATSSVNLAALGKNQSVRFLDEMPRLGKSPEKFPARFDETTPLGTRTVAGPRHSPPSKASPAVQREEEDDEADDDDEIPALPRTKSQLSMLIDKERAHNGVETLGRGPSRRGSRVGKRDKEEDGDNDAEKGEEEEEEEEEEEGEETENELLVMARKDRKGKTNDPDQGFRALARKGLLKERPADGDDMEGSVSPPPVF